MQSFPRKKVTTYYTHWTCDCGGELKPTGTCFVVDEHNHEIALSDLRYLYTPPKYQHRCDKCSKTEDSTKRYPYLEYEEEKN